MFDKGKTYVNGGPSHGGQGETCGRFSLGGLFEKVCFGWWGHEVHNRPLERFAMGLP